VVGQYQTVSVLLTQTSQAFITQSATQPPVVNQPEKTLLAPSVTLTDTPVSYTGLEVSSGTPPAVLPAVPCDLARAGMPFDVTVPDDTTVYPGEYFSKTWRLINAGSCNWDANYAVVWFSGDELGLNRAQNFNGVVAVGQSVDVTVDMLAPETPGVYQSNWKLRNNQGTLFGIGPGGSAPFWARVVVVSILTDTPTTPLPPTLTPTPQVFNTGTVDLIVDTGLDLDSGMINQAAKDDLRYQVTEQGQAQLLPENGARLVVFGQALPGFLDCASLSLSTTPILMDDLQPGAYLCYRTTEGLPGRVSLTAYDPQRQSMTLEYLTWAVP
jgi:hypothetical protein